MATDPAAFEARRLLRAARAATLATAADGQPFASLVTPACAPDLSPLLWLSSLSEHTRQLRAEPRCALLCAGEPDGPNPQTAPRITLTGIAELVPEDEAASLKRRWLARHPYAALYSEFADFALWRVRPLGALLVGGFARATRLRREALLPDAAAVAAISAAETEILEHVNSAHADAVAAIGAHLPGGTPGAWRLAGVDVDGCDLLLGTESSLRLEFSEPVGSPGEVRDQLVRAAREARSASVKS